MEEKAIEEYGVAGRNILMNFYVPDRSLVIYKKISTDTSYLIQIRSGDVENWTGSDANAQYEICL